MKDAIDLLVSLDQNYLPQLRVLLTSVYLNDPGTPCRVYLLHSGIPAPVLEQLRQELARLDFTLHPIPVDDALFQDAPVMQQYPKEMYYRLLAGQLLPEELDRVLYLDPDILVINSLQPLWQADMEGCLFAAAAHTGLTELANNVNRLRLGTEQNYYNSGVLLIDLARCRQEIVPEDIFAFVRAHGPELLLPDQDILNAMYADRILALDDVIWNYDARNYRNYLMRSYGEADLPWVTAHTAILHFCGREKPWKPHYRRRFGVLYLHYMQLTARLLAPAEAGLPDAPGAPGFDQTETA